MYTISISLTYYLRELHNHFTDEKLVIKHSKDFYVINLLIITNQEGPQCI